MPNRFSNLYFVEPSPTARRLLWHVLSIGSVTLEERDQHDAFDKPGAHLFWVVSGRGVMKAEKVTYPLKAGSSCWLVDLRKPRTYIPDPKSRLTTAGFRFGGLGIETWQEVLGQNKIFTFDPPEELAAIRRIQRQLLQLVTRRPRGYEWRVHELITEVLGVLLKKRNTLSAPRTEPPEPVRRVINALLANPARDWKARELATIAQVSYSGLRRLFKNTQHESIHEFIQRTRLDQARMLLSNPSFSVKEVADQLNFSSEYYFSHFFRRTSGHSPTQFRQSLKKGRPLALGVEIPKKAIKPV